jgi:pyruvate/2-oxoglutarate dehydrogenase complex dihydrolipoamide dehydrogenase (E3) component
VHPEGAFEWRDFMVAEYEDGAKVAYLESKGIVVLRGPARLAGAGSVEVGDELHSADHVVLATGSDPVIPPVPATWTASGPTARSRRSPRCRTGCSCWAAGRWA